MKNSWSDERANACANSLELRVYSSNLLGKESALVLHGGGNTSVKIDDVLYVKGSGWDLASIEARGFAPVRIGALLAMAALEGLSDADMVRAQKEAMLRADAPTPSVEAILHALIPFSFVDHTHADAIVTLSNSKGGKERLEALFPRFLIIPYVMPGFILARTIFLHTRAFNWEECEGIILMHHGIFTFDNDAKRSYTKMIDAVSIAEAFLEKEAPLHLPFTVPTRNFDLKALCDAIQAIKGAPLFYHLNQSPLALSYAKTPFTCKGVLTPEHIIRTKRVPLVLRADETIDEALLAYVKAYEGYFKTYATNHIRLNPAPNYAVIEDFGVVSFGSNKKEVSIINDIITHTMEAVLRAEALGGYQSIGLKDSFEMEYWELEQAKLRKT